MNKHTRIEVTAHGNEITVREGEALKLREPQAIVIEGVLDSPLRWLAKRKSTLNELNCCVIVNREAMEIALLVDEKSHYRDTINGRLEAHPDFKKFGINNGEYLTNFEMAQLFKMNRSCFENQSVAMKLVSELQNFKAKVDKEIESADNNRGDRRLLLAQTVNSNLPESFKLSLHIFKGTPKQTFEVEVYIRPDDLCCTLVSPAANDLIAAILDREIDSILDKIKELTPEIVIIER